MKYVIIIFSFSAALIAFAQTSLQSSLFDKEWVTLVMANFSQGTPMESAFPTGFKIIREKEKVLRTSFVTHPGSLTDTFSSSIDTLDLKKKVIAYSKAGRRMETVISISKDEKQINIKRDFFYADEPKKLEFSFDEVIELLDNGDAIIRKTAKATDPDSPWNFVGEKVYPKDGIPTENKG